MEKSARSGFGYGIVVLVAALGAGSVGCAETARKPPAMTQLLAAPDEAAPDGKVETKKPAAGSKTQKAQANAASGDDEQTWWRPDWRR